MFFSRRGLRGHRNWESCSILKGVNICIIQYTSHIHWQILLTVDKEISMYYDFDAFLEKRVEWKLFCTWGRKYHFILFFLNFPSEFGGKDSVQKVPKNLICDCVFRENQHSRHQTVRRRINKFLPVLSAFIVTFALQVLLLCCMLCPCI